MGNAHRADWNFGPLREFRVLAVSGGGPLLGGVKGWVVLELGRPPKMFKRGSTGKKGGQGCGAGPRDGK